MRARLVLVLPLCGALLSSCGGDDPPSSARTRSDSGCPAQIHASRSLSWSRRGNKLAVSGAEGIFILDTDTCEVSRVTDGAADPEWSPDGHKLVYTRSEGLFSSNEDGSNVHQITRVAQIDGYSDACPAWSPRGDFIVFLRREEPVADTVLLSLQIVRPDGKGERQIADMGSPNARETPICPAWSPDGRWIAWKACRAPEPPGVCLINIHENQRVVKVARTSVFSTLDPSWSPDGTMIAFTLYDDVDSAGPGRLMLVAATGGLARQLLQKPPPLISQEGDFSSSWSGDGQSIAFVRQRKRLGTNEVFVVRPDGSGLHRLTKAPAEATR